MFLSCSGCHRAVWRSEVSDAIFMLEREQEHLFVINPTDRHKYSDIRFPETFKYCIELGR